MPLVGGLLLPGGSRIPQPDRYLDELAVAPNLNLGFSLTLTFAELGLTVD
jgi:hypothetical protein